MNVVKQYYVKTRIRNMCYKHKFYLVKFEVSSDGLAIRCTTKDKSGFHRVIEKEYPTRDILRKLPKYLLDLSFCMNPKNQVINITKEEYVKHYKL